MPPAETAIPGRTSPTRAALIARVPGRPNRSHFPKEDFHIDLEAGTCTCPAGNVTRRIRPSGTRTTATGRTHQLKAFQFEGAVCGVCPLLRARQDEIPVVPGGHGGQPDPGGGQGRPARRHRRRLQCLRGRSVSWAR